MFPENGDYEIESTLVLDLESIKHFVNFNDIT